MNEIIQQILKKRNQIYGNYLEGCKLRQQLVHLISQRYIEEHSKPIPEVYKEFFWDISNKLVRLAVTPDHIDSWRDIAGYAELIVNALEKGEHNAD